MRRPPCASSRQPSARWSLPCGRTAGSPPHRRRTPTTSAERRCRPARRRRPGRVDEAVAVDRLQQRRPDLRVAQLLVRGPQVEQDGRERGRRVDQPWSPRPAPPGRRRALPTARRRRRCPPPRTPTRGWPRRDRTAISMPPKYGPGPVTLALGNGVTSESADGAAGVGWSPVGAPAGTTGRSSAPLASSESSANGPEPDRRMGEVAVREVRERHLAQQMSRDAAAGSRGPAPRRSACRA